MIAPLISDVSDTARWVAAYRARESARPDALFRDPLAARLAGDRGQRIARALARPGDDGWPLVTRTQLIDQLVTTAVAGGCDCVLDLAAGFDTRPYRYSLFHEGVRLRRVPRLFRPFAWIPPPNPRAPGNKRWAGVVRLTREPAHT